MDSQTKLLAVHRPADELLSIERLVVELWRLLKAEVGLVGELEQQFDLSLSKNGVSSWKLSYSIVLYFSYSLVFVKKRFGSWFLLSVS